MKYGLIATLVFCFTLTPSFSGQDAPAAPSFGPPSAHGGDGQHDQRSGFLGGNGIAGTVTAVAADHYIIKTPAGERYTIYFSANTRILKQRIQRDVTGGEGMSPQTLKPTEIKVDDEIGAMGEVDAATKSVGAVVIAQIDPERAHEMRAMQASFGKTWLLGKVTAIHETQVVVQSTVDNAAHAFMADEDTSFRKRREPISLADLRVGDMVRAEGAVRDGFFVASTVVVLGTPPDGTPSLPRANPPSSLP
jgi:hypothetical protein